MKLKDQTLVHPKIIAFQVHMLAQLKMPISFYSTALLMNLALRSAGKLKAEEDASGDILAVLNDLLESDNFQVRTHVNGTLYSILTRPALREKAMSMGLDELLKSLMAQDDCPEQFKKQMEYILQQLTKSAEDEEGDDVAEAKSEDGDDDDDDDDDDDFGGDDEEEEAAPTEPDEEENEMLRAATINSQRASLRVKRFSLTATSQMAAMR